MKVLYFSNVNYNWIKQRPHFLSKEMSELGHEVTFFSTTPFLKQRKSNLKMDGKLRILDIYVIPFANKFEMIRKINFRIISLFTSLDFNLVILTHPRQLGFLEYIRYEGKIVYDCMDNISAFYSGNIKKIIESEERKLCAVSNKIIVSSRNLECNILKKYKINPKKIRIIRNTLNRDLFYSSSMNLTLSHPNLMYVGTIDKWFDIDKILIIINSFNDTKIYLVGPISKEMNERLNHPNIVKVGKVGHDRLLSYLLEADIFIVPFLVDELIKGVDPIKLYEFSAMMKPIISSYWDELDHFKEKVEFYKSSDDLIRLIKEKRNAVFSKYIDYHYVDNNTWLTRAQLFIEYIES